MSDACELNKGKADVCRSCGKCMKCVSAMMRKGCDDCDTFEKRYQQLRERGRV